MRVFLLAVALVAAAPLRAEPEFAYRGQWDVTFASDPGYVGVVLIDGQRRVTWDSPKDNGRPAKFLGYVRAATNAHVEIVLTNRADVVIIDCVAESTSRLHCRSTYDNGAYSPMYALTRRGGGPASLSTKK